MKWNYVKLVEGESPWVTLAKRQVYQKNNCVSIICLGKPGSGKSYALLNYFCMLDPDFDVDKQCFFRAPQIIKFFKDLSSDEKAAKQIKGKPILYDEAGIDAHSSKWQDSVNIALNMFLQTGRSLNYWLGVTVPYQSFISKGVRTLMNVRFEAQGWTKDKRSIIKAFTQEWNDEMQKFYKKRLLVEHNGNMSFCSKLELPLAPAEKIKRYEELKLKYQNELYTELNKKIESKAKENEKSDLIKCRDVGKELGVSKSTTQVWAKKGEIKAQKIGGRWFMDKKERERLLNSQKNQEIDQKDQKDLNYRNSAAHNLTL